MTLSRRRRRQASTCVHGQLDLQGRPGPNRTIEAEPSSIKQPRSTGWTPHIPRKIGADETLSKALPSQYESGWTWWTNASDSKRAETSHTVRYHRKRLNLVNWTCSGLRGHVTPIQILRSGLRRRPCHHKFLRYEDCCWASDQQWEDASLCCRKTSTRAS